jgi:hypothetical protein
MDYNDLLTKYRALQSENHRLREENKRLRLQLSWIPFDFVPHLGATELKPLQEMMKADSDEVGIPDINNLSTPSEKIKLFIHV